MLTEQKVEPSTDNTDWKTVLKFLLSNVPFLLFLIGHTLVASSLRVLASIQTDILRDRGFTTGDTTTALMIFNFSGIPGRLVVGLVKKIPHGSSFIFVVITAFFATPAIIGLRFINNLWQAALLSSMCGIALGAAHASNGVSLLSLVGTDYSTPAVGLSFGVTGILVTVTGPLMGSIRDSTTSYTLTMSILSGAVLTGSLFYFLSFWLKRKKDRIEKLLSKSSDSLNMDSNKLVFTVSSVVN